MNKKLPESPQNASDHLANERTLLAWTRTGIAIMAFGFVVVKFSLFVKQLAYLVSGEKVQVPVNSRSGVYGVVIVIVGALTLIISYVQYKKTEKQLIKGQYQPSSKLILILLLAMLITSVFLIAYLISSLQ
ncbi:MAG: YidH family protein [Niabella sp.]